MSRTTLKKKNRTFDNGRTDTGARHGWKNELKNRRRSSRERDRHRCFFHDRRENRQTKESAARIFVQHLYRKYFSWVLFFFLIFVDAIATSRTRYAESRLIADSPSEKVLWRSEFTRFKRNIINLRTRHNVEHRSVNDKTEKNVAFAKRRLTGKLIRNTNLLLAKFSEPACSCVILSMG